MIDLIFKIVQGIKINLAVGFAIGAFRMDDIFRLAAQEGITALDLTADSLRDWLADIIDKNNIKIVLIWDEFSDYFRQNST